VLDDSEWDDSGWADIRRELRNVNASDAEIATLISHISHRLTGHFGNDRIEVWRAKEGLHKHPVDEVASLIVAKLAPLINELPPGTIERLRTEEKLDAAVVFPWTDRWDPPAPPAAPGAPGAPA